MMLYDGNFLKVCHMFNSIIITFCQNLKTSINEFLILGHSVNPSLVGTTLVLHVSGCWFYSCSDFMKKCCLLVSNTFQSRILRTGPSTIS